MDELEKRIEKLELKMKAIETYFKLHEVMMFGKVSTMLEYQEHNLLWQINKELSDINEFWPTEKKAQD